MDREVATVQNQGWKKLKTLLSKKMRKYDKNNDDSILREKNKRLATTVNKKGTSSETFSVQ